jgi:hypothetical protein
MGEGRMLSPTPIDTLPGKIARSADEKLFDYERFGFAGENCRHIFLHKNGLQNQSVLYLAWGFQAEPRAHPINCPGEGRRDRAR